MATSVTMPRMSESMEQGTVLKWLVAVGAEVKRGDPLVEIETDKANLVFEAEVDGVLLAVSAAEGQTIIVGGEIATIGVAGEEPAAAAARTGDAPAGAPTGKGNGGGPANRIKISPTARRLAQELGVELGSIQGSGPHGRIVRSDIEAAVDAQAPAATAVATPDRSDPEPIKGRAHHQELTRLQATVGRRMSQSKATAPDFQLQVEIDMTRCLELRARLQTVLDRAPSLNDIVVKAAASALRAAPRVNGAYRDGRWELFDRVNVGLAVASGDALVVPVIRDADRKTLNEIASNTRELVDAVRRGSITEPALTGATFTISNLGMYGIDSFSAIIDPPQAAILAVGRVRRKPAVDETGAIIPRELMTATLSCDHRILYGAEAAGFLADVRRLLEEPLLILVD
jgi:pyruvate dehydrogenase E2 component (dihydrolipoamide acetyltransferase)